MSDPFVTESLEMEFSTGEPKRLIQIRPNRFPGNNWFHDPAEFDRSQDIETVIDSYTLPESDEYELRLIEDPTDFWSQVGEIAPTDDHSGGGKLIQHLDRETFPSSWVIETTTLTAYLE